MKRKYEWHWCAQQHYHCCYASDNGECELNNCAFKKERRRRDEDEQTH